MVETSKQVRVDNWGIYFLQRLQLFFSKTDYCDLTLQFEGNVQLKVHRLVMNACTEYFAFLEQTCPAMEENTIMMPSDLQADVIVPIVNFMYTGMLEFHPSIYDKLCRAAETMNIAVLTKLLEAQLAPISKMTSRNRNRDTIEKSSWKEVKKQKSSAPVANDLPATLPGKKLPVWKNRNPPNASIMQTHPVSGTYTPKWKRESATMDSEPVISSHNTPKPTRFEWPEEDLTPIPSLYPTFEDVSLTSKPLWTKEDDHKPPGKVEEYKPIQYSNRKRNSMSIDEEFHEKEQKVDVAQLEEPVVEVPVKRKAESKGGSSPKRVKITSQEEETIINITTSNPNDVDHTKIVSEILKKYPELVKKKRSIKLKITQAKPDTSQNKVQIREKTKSPQASPKTPEKPAPATPKEVKRDSTKTTSKDTSRLKKQKLPLFSAASEDGPWICMECLGQDRDGAEFVLYYLFRKHMADHHHMEFDSTLCKYCGKKCEKENHMTYHLYTKHGLKPPRDVVFPKCNKCPFIAVTTDRLEEHKKTHAKDHIQCMGCQLGFKTKKDLSCHQQLSKHATKACTILECTYCKKKLQSPVTLFTHVRAQHMKEAKRDGITSLDEVMDIQSEIEEEEEVQEEEKDEEQVAEELPEITRELNEKHEKVEVIETIKAEEKPLKDKVKIISNVKVDNAPKKVVTKKASTTIPAQETAVAVTTTAAAALSNIGNSLATNLGLVDIVVLDDNQQYILQQPQGQAGNAEFILPRELGGSEGILQAAAASGELNSTDELVMVLTDDYQDEQTQGQSENSNIVVLYSHPVEGQGQFITSQGNILVNSEGMLEIRNGTAITTTAGGQILINDNTTTTTTQSQESPIESIDLIRKEIEGSRPVNHRETIKTVLRKKVLEKEIRQFEKDDSPPPEVENEAATENSLNEKDKEPAEDVTDSSMPEEPMDVDENVTEEKENLIADTEKGEIEEVTTPAAISQEQPTTIEESLTEENSQEPQDEDCQKEPAVVAATNSTEDTPARLEDQLSINDQKIEEPMEVDSVEDTKEPSENVEGHDEVDNQESTKSPSNVEAANEIQSENQEVHPEESNNEPILENTAASEKPNTDNENPIVEENSVEKTENETNPVNQQVENEVNDSNDNIQPSFEDFTDDSQQSSSQQAHKDVNKEILDDWDDTDSQQSQNQEQDHKQDNQEGAKNAVENVNKLMDDWEEEDEDQSKE